MNYPEIRFRDSFLLINSIYSDIEPAYMPPKVEIDERYKLSRQFIQDKLREYEGAWRAYEKQLIEGMCAITGLEFKLNVIDIYTAPFYTSFSFPMVLATKYEPDRVVEVITHELLHILLYDNKSEELDLEKKEKEWRELFGNIDDGVALIHIPVHAIMQELFDDVLDEPARTERDKSMCANSRSYQEAWNYVDRVGRKKIIQSIQARHAVAN